MGGQTVFVYPRLWFTIHSDRKFQYIELRSALIAITVKVIARAVPAAQPRHTAAV